MTERVNSDETVLRLECKKGRGRRVALSVVAGEQQIVTHLLDVTDEDARRDFMDRLRRKCEDETLRGVSEEALCDIEDELDQLAYDHVHEATEDRAQSDRLVDLAEQQFQIGQNPAREPFAVAKEGPRIARLFRGGHASLRAELSARYFDTYNKAPNSSALTDALLTLEGKALRTVPQHTFLRLGLYEDDVVLDLGREDGKVVTVAPAGWRVVEQSPILFRRTELTGELPVPIVDRHGLDTLRSLLNVSEESWPLVVGWLVSSLVPEIPHPIVLMSGLQGTGKSTNAKHIGAVVDPSPALLRTPPRDIEQWGVEASASWIVPVDNVSRISPWWSDALCRAATGDGIIRRRLYSDNNLSVLTFRRCVMLTAIDAGAMRGDLAERLLVIELDPISTDQRRLDDELRRAFNRAHPRILGGLLDVTVEVLRVLPTVHLTHPPRMADFAHVLRALDLVQGTSALPTYLGQHGRVAEDVIEGDAVAVAVRDFARVQSIAWQGTAGELLDKLTPERAPKGWPQNPRGFSAAIRKVLPALALVGVTVTPPGRNDRIWTVNPSRDGAHSTVSTVGRVSEQPKCLQQKAITCATIENGRTDDQSPTEEPIAVDTTVESDVTAGHESSFAGSYGPHGPIRNKSVDHEVTATERERGRL